MEFGRRLLQQPPDQRDRTRHALIGAALATQLAGPAHSQDGGLEEIVVTGSRISRPDFESASPIVSITQAAFERTGSTSVDTAMNRLPQLVPTFTSTSNNPANGGQGNLNLRGLGPVSTLVLVDGRRLIPANGNGVVDVNIIPAALVESVEIITGGASAVYGSDAIAGVVNFKLKKDFEGLQFDGSWAVTDQGDGEEYSAGITGGFGFADGRGEVLGYVGYSERETLSYDARDFSRYSLGYFGPGAGGIRPRRRVPAVRIPDHPGGSAAGCSAAIKLHTLFGRSVCSGHRAVPDELRRQPGRLAVHDGQRQPGQRRELPR